MNGTYDPKKIMRVEYQGQVAFIQIDRLILENGLAATNDPMLYFREFLREGDELNLTIKGRVVPDRQTRHTES